MKRILLWGVALGLLAPSKAWPQPTLDSLWPNEDGLRWTYSGTYEDIFSAPASFTGILQMNGTVPLFGGGTGQNLEGLVLGWPTGSDGRTGPAGLQGFWRQLWMARPTLRHRIEALAKLQTGAVEWPLLILHPGAFVKSPSNIGTWSEVEDYFGWWFLTDDLTPGAQWMLQLARPLADDVFLYGTVTFLTSSVSTDAGTFDDAVQMDYRVDHGLGTITNENGEPLGTMRSETTGTAYFVPSLGPVACVEDFSIVELDCPTCPPEEWPVGVSIMHGELDLQSLPVAAESSSWGRLKARFAGP